jgi:hypothetical protein
MKEFPEFMKQPVNRIAASRQAIPGVEGYVFKGADASQKAFWTRETARSAAHAHEFDEYMVVVRAAHVDRCRIAEYTSLVQRHRSHNQLNFSNPLHSWLSISVFALFALGVIATFWAEHRVDHQLQMWQNWPATPGTSSGSRIVEDSFVTVPRSHSQRWYICECRVEYSVRGSINSVWTEAYRNVDSKWLTDCRQTCSLSHYNVHYDPDRPSDGRAFITAPKGP